MVRMLKVCFARILFACEFDASLDLADGHAGEMEINVIGALQPSEHSATAPWGLGLRSSNTTLVLGFPRFQGQFHGSMAITS